MTEPTVTLPPPEPAPTSKGRGRKAVIGGLAAAVVLGGGYGAYAVYDKLDGGGTQPHDVLPASTQFYARIDVDPSASQKIELFKLIRKFPEVADEIGITSTDQDVRKLIFDELISSECPDLDYEDDVEPWLGSRIGIGGNIETETFEIAVQTTDEQKSRAGIKKLFACSDDDYGIAYLDGYAILSEKQSTVDDAVAETKKGTLGDSAQFTDDFEALGDQGVASAWVDLEALAKVPEVKDSLGADLDEITKAGSVATTLRVDGNALELAALSGAAQTGDAKPTDLGTLPADTVAALSVAGVGDQVGEAFDAFIAGLNSGFGGVLTSGEAFAPVSATVVSPDPTDPTIPPTPTDPPIPNDDDFGQGDLDPFGTFDAQDFVDEIERQTGFKLPEDLETLFGDSLTLAVGSKNLENLPTLSGPDDVSSLDVALALTSDPAKALDLVQRIATFAERGGIPLVTVPTDDGAVLATNQDAADAVAEPDGKLGDQPAFREVIPDGTGSYGGLFVDIGTIIDKLQAADPPEDVARDLEQAEALSAFGFSVTEKDDRSLLRVRLSFEE